MKQFRQFLLTDKGIIILEILLLAVFLFWRFRLGLVRYFDADEITHIHWGYSFYIGERPYTDFFYLFPPFFLYPIASLFAIFGRSLAVLTAARIFVFFVFTSMVLILFLIGRKLRGSLVGLTTVVIFAFLPLPSDKMIEVRPDLLATMLAMLGLYLFILAEEKRGKLAGVTYCHPEAPAGAEGSHWDSSAFSLRMTLDCVSPKLALFFSGFFYALSLGFVPKTVFFLIPPAVVTGYKSLKSLKWFKREGSLFILGFLPPAIVLLLLIFSFGNPSFAIFCMTGMASSITAVLGKKFYMGPDIFFYQNDTYYGIAGYSLPYLANLVIYISASLWAIHKFISLGSSTEVSSSPVVSRGDIQVREFLVAGSFFANLYAFVFAYPLKHAQYLIPVAPFIAFYFADLVMAILVPSPRGSHVRQLTDCHPRGVLRLLLFISILFLLGLVGGQMYGRKMQFRDKPMLDKIAVLLKTIPKDEAVFDLTGESIFFPNGYYFCCLPYGQYEEALGFDPPNLGYDLEKRNTKYVYAGSPDRLDVLPSLQAKHIRDNFIPYFPDGSLLIKK